MSSHPLSHRARQIEKLFDSSKPNSLQGFALQEMSCTVAEKGLAPSAYNLFAVRKNDNAGSEIFGPRSISVGSYSEETLYGAVVNSVPHFRSVIRHLAAKSSQLVALDQDDVEYTYQMTLFWSEVAKLKDFLGGSVHISELVNEFLTARYQFIGKDTPHCAIAAVATALAIAKESRRYDSSIVERVVDALEAGGIDPLAVDALRKSDG